MSYCLYCRSYDCTCKEEKQENPFMCFSEPEPIKIPKDLLEIHAPTLAIEKSKFTREICPDCNGSGLEKDMFIIGGYSSCGWCRGSGYIRVRKQESYY